MKHADPVHGPAYTVYGQNPTQPARGAVQRVGFHRFPGFHGFREAIAAGTLHERWKRKWRAREMKLARCGHEIELGIDLEHRSPRQVVGHQWRQHATTGTSSTEARTQHGLRWWRGWADGLRGLEPDESNPGPTCHAAWDGLVYRLDWVPTAPRTGRAPSQVALKPNVILHTVINTPCTLAS